MRKLTLVGYKAKGVQARVASETRFFMSTCNKVCVVVSDDLTVTVRTAKGHYPLSKHPTKNYFNGECNGHKVQTHLKAVSGWLQFW